MKSQNNNQVAGKSETSIKYKMKCCKITEADGSEYYGILNEKG